MTVAVVADALSDLVKYFEALPEVAVEAAVLAVNDAASGSLSPMRKKVESQVAFPKGYLSPQRLGITKKASKGSIEAVVTGRDRPTSLARFTAPGSNPRNTRGRPLKVTVKPGHTIPLKRAFLVNLRNGNTGLAVRLPKGQTLDNSTKAVRLDNNVYLLYGPSVDQVLQSVMGEEVPTIGDRVNKEFLRQFARLSTRG